MNTPAEPALPWRAAVSLALCALLASCATAPRDARCRPLDRAAALQKSAGSPLRDPQRCQRLDNGNTLVVLSLGNAVVEYDRNGTIAWSRDGFDVPLDAHRLPDDNTVVVDRHGLHEISPEGKEVWHHAVAGASRAWPH